MTSEKSDKDHIPFNGLFLCANPSGIKKLSVHYDCHHDEYSFDEEYVLILITLLSASWSPSADPIWKNKVLPDLMSRHKKTFRERLLKEIKPGGHLMSNLPEILKNIPAVKISSRRLQKVLFKIVRGLYFSDNQETIESKFLDLKLESIKQLGIFPAGLEFKAVGKPDGSEFKYGKRTEDDSLVYFLQFYNTFLFKIVAFN